jgi:hypothetical protein
METSATLQPETLGRMSFAGVSPAKTSALWARVQELMASAAAYGKSTPELLAKYDPDTSSWRTSQLCLGGDLAEFSEIWPRSGSMLNGIAYQLPPLAPVTDATDSGLWPTPSARDWKDTPGMMRQAEARNRTDQLPRAVYAAEMASSGDGTLNPNWVEWLMGFPVGWTDLKHSAIQSCRKSQNL